MNTGEEQEIEQIFSDSWERTGNYFIIMFFWDDPSFLALTLGINLSTVYTLEEINDHASRHKWMKPIQDLMQKMRKRGLDRQLRAGISLTSLILTRSRTHGLRNDQAGLRITLREEGGMELIFWGEPHGRIEIEVPTVELTPEVEQLLAKLLAQPID